MSCNICLVRVHTFCHFVLLMKCTRKSQNVSSFRWLLNANYLLVCYTISRSCFQNIAVRDIDLHVIIRFLLTQRIQQERKQFKGMLSSRCEFPFFRNDAITEVLFWCINHSLLPLMRFCTKLDSLVLVFGVTEAEVLILYKYDTNCTPGHQYIFKDVAPVCSCKWLLWSE